MDACLNAYPHLLFDPQLSNATGANKEIFVGPFAHPCSRCDFVRELRSPTRLDVVSMFHKVQTSHITAPDIYFTTRILTVAALPENKWVSVL